MIIVGLGGLLNDPACAVLRDGRIVSAIEQKKLARRFEAGELPEEALAEALRLASVQADEIDTVAIARPYGDRVDSHLQIELRERFPHARVVPVDHHQAHAASAFFASPFENATVLTLDRSGDFRCGAFWRGEGTRLELEREIYYPDSLGDLYSRVTELLGFEPRSEEHKVQWLSTSAGADLAPVFQQLVRQDAGGYRLDRDFFDADRIGRGGFSTRFYDALGLDDSAELTDRWKSRIAAGLQRAVEELVLELAGSGENLCVAGGLGFNALLVAALERSGKWRNVFVQPASGNSGTAFGAAYAAWHLVHRQARSAPMESLALGPSYSAEEIKQVLENCKLRFKFVLTAEEILQAAIRQLSGDKIVAWMQGRMEFGARALGNRSILASPLNPYSSENLNVFIKHRESFRKFAASVPAELASQYFEVGSNARFLSTVGRVREEHKKTFESAILGDGLVRVHTVDEQENPLFHKLLHAWGSATALPVLYNTSFNLFGDPLVCTPRDAVRSFYSSGVDAMIAGNFLLEK